MLNSLNKTKYSRGGIYFSSAVAIVSILGCCGEVQAEDKGMPVPRIIQKDISDIINLFNNISWRIIANNKIVDADEGNWITERKYNESIIKVIAQAVADCITDKNEFAFRKEGDLITFDVDAKDYTDENWNAVVLWNYLHVLKWDYLNNSLRSKDEVFDEVRRRICDKYPTEGVVDLEWKLNKAISDIKEYDKELSLADEMKEFGKVSKTMHDGWMQTRIRDHQFDRITLSPIGSWLIRRNRYNEEENGAGIGYSLKAPAEFCAVPMNVSFLFNPELKAYMPIKVKRGKKIWIANDFTFRLYKNDDIYCEVYKILKQDTQRKDKWIANYIVRNEMTKLFDDLNIRCMNLVY